MEKRLRFCASVLFLVLMGASGSAQTQSQPEVVKAEPRDLPISFSHRASRLNASPAPRLFKQQGTDNDAQGLDLFRKVNAVPTPSIVQTQVSGNNSWTQWSKDPQHTGFINVDGQSFGAVLDDIVYDPHAAASAADQGGDLLVHYQTPLTDGEDVFMEFKTGTFTTLQHWETQIWNQKRLSRARPPLTSRCCVRQSAAP